MSAAAFLATGVEAPPSSHALHVEQLRVEVSPRFELDCGNLNIPGGARVALVGANGAGKSTFLEALAGIRPARIEKVEVLGESLPAMRADPALRARLGVQLQNVFYPRDIAVAEIVRLHDFLYGPDVCGAAEMFGLAALLRRPFGRLSQGERQRVHLYVGLAHEADLVLLDEPSVSLDPRFTARLYDWLARTKSTVLLATHEAGALQACTHLLWLAGGRVRRYGAIPALMEDLLGRFRLDAAFACADARDSHGAVLARALGARTRLDQPHHGLSLFCDRRPGEEAMAHLQRDAVSFGISTSSRADLLALASHEGEQCLVASRR